MIMMNHTHTGQCRMWTRCKILLLTYVRFVLYTLAPPQRTTHATLRARGASEARRGGGDGGGDGGHKATYEEARGDMRRKSTSTCNMHMSHVTCACACMSQGRGGVYARVGGGAVLMRDPGGATCQCVQRGGVRRARGASDERARQTQLVTASSDICLSLCFSRHHGRRCGMNGVWRVACGVWHMGAAVARGQLGIGGCAAAPRGLLGRLG